MKIRLLKFTTYILFFLLLLLAFVVAWFSFNSRDTPKQDLGDFSQQPLILPDEENGFLTVDFTGLDKDQTDPEHIDQEQLRLILKGETWNQVFIDKILGLYESQILSLLSVDVTMAFQISPPDEPLILPSYTPTILLARLALIKAMDLERQGQLDQALAIYASMLDIVQSIKLEKNNFLISYLIGSVIQDETVLGIHRYLTAQELSASQTSKALMILESIPSLENEGFEKIFLGEFEFIKAYLDFLRSGETIKTRWEKYINNEDPLAESWIFSPDLSGYIVRFLMVLFPDFYVHKQRSLTLLAEHYQSEISKMASGCPFTKENDYVFKQITIKDILTPNALGINTSGPLPSFNHYYNRRCLSFTLIEATKTIAAIKLFELENAKLPESTDELLDGYLDKLPMDYFTGKPLAYSKENGWLYSYGFNGNDDGGSSQTLYHPLCHQDDCANNPTFPISNTKTIEPIISTN